MKWMLAACLILVLCAAQAGGESELVVGVKPAEPFIIVADDGLVSGFSIDLLEHILAQLEAPVPISYHVDPDIPTHLTSIRVGRVDFGIAATTITSERLGSFEFSHPFYLADLGIIAEKEPTPDLLSRIFTRNVLFGIILVLVYMIVAGHIIWLIEREEDGHFHTSYLRGVATGVWWTIVTMSTVGYGDVYPKKPLGKAFASFVIIIGIAIFGFTVATFSSAMTVSQLHAPAILGPGDLAARPVAVIAGTQTVFLAEERGMQPVPVGSLGEAVALLKGGQVDAVVHDTPLLKYYLKNNPDAGLALAPQTFEIFTYGITYPKGSPWREKLDPILITTLEDGTYEKIHTRWFGVRE
jgi:ABC-type amino acid transport substrate-binding protein